MNEQLYNVQYDCAIDGASVQCSDDLGEWKAIAVSTGADPRAGDDDLTAKARIRNAALDLYAQHGEDRTSMRAIATAAGVTVGLVAHHFGNRDGVRDAVEQLVVDHFRVAIRQTPVMGTPEEISAGRNAGVAEMLRRNPVIVDYLRRALLDPSGRSQLLQRMTDLAQHEMAVPGVTDSGAEGGGGAEADRPDSRIVVKVMVRQLGRLFLQPMLDAMWTHLEGSEAPYDRKPLLEVGVQDPE
jgi:AcrR family transcriptional regulator